MILIKNGYVIDPRSGREGKANVLIEGEKVKRIARDEEIDEACEVIDAEGLIVAPGLIDVHVHFREPGFTYKEDIQSGARAAAKESS